MFFEEYLGDGLYAAYDGFQLVLAANDKVSGNPSDKVYLDPRVVENLESYVKRLRSEGIQI